MAMLVLRDFYGLRLRLVYFITQMEQKNIYFENHQQKNIVFIIIIFFIFCDDLEFKNKRK